MWPGGELWCAARWLFAQLGEGRGPRGLGAGEGRLGEAALGAAAARGAYAAARGARLVAPPLAGRQPALHVASRAYEVLSLGCLGEDNDWILLSKVHVYNLNETFAAPSGGVRHLSSDALCPGANGSQYLKRSSLCTALAANLPLGTLPALPS